MHFDPWATLYAGDVGAAFTATLRCIPNERTVFYVLGKRLCLATPFESQLYSEVRVTATTCWSYRQPWAATRFDENQSNYH